MKVHQLGFTLMAAVGVTRSQGMVRFVREDGARIMVPEFSPDQARKLGRALIAAAGPVVVRKRRAIKCQAGKAGANVVS